MSLFSDSLQKPQFFSWTWFISFSQTILYETPR
jgi:hypothetical protein